MAFKGGTGSRNTQTELTNTYHVLPSTPLALQPAVAQGPCLQRRTAADLNKDPRSTGVPARRALCHPHSTTTSWQRLETVQCRPTLHYPTGPRLPSLGILGILGCKAGASATYGCSLNTQIQKNETGCRTPSSTHAVVLQHRHIC